jgi:fatty acid desaturase
MTGVYDSSRTLLDPLHNFLGFNSGHHTAHHEKPTLHWSLLPARTLAISHRIPAELRRKQDAPKRGRNQGAPKRGRTQGAPKRRRSQAAPLAS